jgi:hypothetical protein
MFRSGVCESSPFISYNRAVRYRTTLVFHWRKLHREPHCIAGKPNAWRLSDIREYCLGPQRRFGKVALHPYHTCAQHCWPVQRILEKVFRGSFSDIRACCLQALAHRCTVFEAPCRTLTQFWVKIAFGAGNQLVPLPAADPSEGWPRAPQHDQRRPTGFSILESSGSSLACFAISRQVSSST